VDTASPDWLVAGMEIDKIGAFSGWTYATVSNTCVDFIVVVLPGS
jgi:hypothetical protein